MKFLILASALLAVALGASTRMLPRLDGKIVGGEPTTIEEHPHQISLMAYGSHICGGSVISPKYVVTAAHCTKGYAPSSLTIRAGSTFRTSGGVTVNVATINSHPDHNSNTHDFDISVLELAVELEFSTTISSVKLPVENQEVLAGDDAVCTGWGTTSEGGSLPDQLQAVTVQIISNEDCNAAYDGTITDRMVCAGVTEGGKDSCQGDSGGPLLVNGELVGLVSWGRGCARPEYPGVYSSVPALRSFILEIANV